MEIEINGTKYKKLESKSNSNIKKMSSSVTRALMVATMFSSMSGNNTGSKKQRPYVNIVEEFELIQLKKSKLPRNHRDWVVREFNKKYQKI